MQVFAERNPYNFVPFPPSLAKMRLTPGSSAGHDRHRHELFSGTFQCTLRTRTPLCIRELFDQIHDGQAYIPGSTLRGAVRSVAQALGAGCTAYLNRNTPAGLPESLRPCAQNEACLVCRVFGYAPAKAEQSWAGKVRFHNTPTTAVQWHSLPASPMARPVPNQPEFREEDPGQLAGWRVFRHSRQVGPLGGAVHCVAADQTFSSFEVDFQNLDAEELAVLRFALCLRHECAIHNRHIQLCHKIGYAKASGLGSCQIEITEQPAAFLGSTTRALPAASCELEDYLRMPGWPMLRELLDFERAPLTLLRPGAWLRTHGGASIADFEAQHSTKVTIP